MKTPRRFTLVREVDVTGVSGTGRVADGILWGDGTVSIRWFGPYPSTVYWHSIDAVERVNGHGGATRIVWVDPDPERPMPVLDGLHIEEVIRIIRELFGKGK